MLSPYAMWRFQLIRTQNAPAFDQLKGYKYAVDLELVGKGSFLTDEKGTGFSRLKVDDYYKRDYTVLEN